MSKQIVFGRISPALIVSPLALASTRSLVELVKRCPGFGIKLLSMANVSKLTIFGQTKRTWLVRWNCNKGLDNPRRSFGLLSA
jgi:hypothetical protein